MITFITDPMYWIPMIMSILFTVGIAVEYIQVQSQLPRGKITIADMIIVVLLLIVSIIPLANMLMAIISLIFMPYDSAIFNFNKER